MNASDFLVLGGVIIGISIARELKLPCACRRRDQDAVAGKASNNESTESTWYHHNLGA
jgi:adenine/guanine phosphoribosyltransferase-like PRPP-binding protein